MDVDTAEGTGVAFEKLLFSSVDEVKLDVSVDSLPSVRSRDGEKSTPFSVRGENVSDDLSVFEVSRPVKNFDLFLILFGDADVEDGGRGDHCQEVVSHPSPEDDVLVELEVV